MIIQLNTMLYQACLTSTQDLETTAQPGVLVASVCFQADLAIAASMGHEPLLHNPAVVLVEEIVFFVECQAEDGILQLVTVEASTGRAQPGCQLHAALDESNDLDHLITAQEFANVRLLVLLDCDLECLGLIKSAFANEAPREFCDRVYGQVVSTGKHHRDGCVRALLDHLWDLE